LIFHVTVDLPSPDPVQTRLGIAFVLHGNLELSDEFGWLALSSHSLHQQCSGEASASDETAIPTQNVLTLF
jgi:hypothetical protein